MAASCEEGDLLRGIIEADETYVGGRPRYKHKNNKRGRGTRKTSVVGAVEREGNGKAQVTDDTQAATVLSFIEQAIEPEESALITDEYKAYVNAYKLMPHAVVDHAEGYTDSDDTSIHTNPIEGFWSLLKRAWYGSHHKYSKGWMPLFVAEACYKYNHRKASKSFDNLLGTCLLGT